MIYNVHGINELHLVPPIKVIDVEQSDSSLSEEYCIEVKVFSKVLN